MINFAQRKVLIAGMRYAGEMKKSMFSVLNFCCQRKMFFPCTALQMPAPDERRPYFLACRARVKPLCQQTQTAYSIGDDEHGWGKDTVFNFEGGCYAKTIDLTRKNEPVIYDAIRAEFAIVENVVIDEQRDPDYANSSLTENTRACTLEATSKPKCPKIVPASQQHHLFDLRCQRCAAPRFDPEQTSSGLPLFVRLHRSRRLH